MPEASAPFTDASGHGSLHKSPFKARSPRRVPYTCHSPRAPAPAGSAEWIS